MDEHNETEWRKSSLSQASDCMEWRIDAVNELVYVRNSRHIEVEPMELTFSEWQAFVGGVKLGEADL